MADVSRNVCAKLIEDLGVDSDAIETVKRILTKVAVREVFGSTHTDMALTSVDLEQFSDSVEVLSSSRRSVPMTYNSPMRATYYDDCRSVPLAAQWLVTRLDTESETPLLSVYKGNACGKSEAQALNALRGLDGRLIQRAHQALFNGLIWSGLSKEAKAFEVWCTVGMTAVTGPWSECYERQLAKLLPNHRSNYWGYNSGGASSL